MTTYTWKTGVSRNWGTGGDWTPAGSANTDTANALVDSTGSYAVSIRVNSIGSHSAIRRTM
jgi:hypothetical protein